MSDIVAAGIVPGALEMMDRLSIRATEAATNAGNRLDAGAALIVELDGPEAECGSWLDRNRLPLPHRRADEVRVARDEAERELFWRARQAPLSAPWAAISPSYYVQDSVMPRTRLPEVLRLIDGLAAEYGLPVANVFHAGDGNLHPLVAYDAREARRGGAGGGAAGAIVLACVEAGGSITGEHGVGVDKKRYMPAMFSETISPRSRSSAAPSTPSGARTPGR